MENEFVLSLDHRVPGVSAALVTHDEIGTLRQHVDNFPLSLVTPLCAHYHDAIAVGIEHSLRILSVSSKQEIDKKPPQGSPPAEVL